MSTLQLLAGSLHIAHTFIEPQCAAYCRDKDRLYRQRVHMMSVNQCYRVQPKYCLDPVSDMASAVRHEPVLD